ncbi:hypothetical protein CEE37_06405 [candidate division LCP-89 bacterium B3_LCP]|uniref:Uncharacterized protein n=1 Tax=candidate division LCP-89 bacterium B3_LCP TaxID=2012998 RepID=A0A532V279_UNCL8|nr:MAG: hypothetical protein CEE37_06405 [candidate division LCP-89 bacterium B3_LCP]
MVPPIEKSLKLSSTKKVFWVALFSVAMAYFEAAVVVYLRAIFYPNGFDFPLAMGPDSIIITELGREAATILMLVTIGFLCGRSKPERFAYLLISFGIWDIMYYVWLKVLIGWPSSLLTWDILFLIPLPWVGPCLAPILVSIAMIWAGWWIVRCHDRGFVPQFPVWAWFGEIAAGLIIIVSFIWDFNNIVSGGYPDVFRWDIFLIGMIAGIGLFLFMIKKQSMRY